MPFFFNRLAPPRTPVFTAELREGIRNSTDLLRELGFKLRFPDYFGVNWNALEECIRDLSWLPRGSLALEHRDLPLAGDSEGQKIYLSIRSDASQKRWTLPEQRIPDLMVIFPPSTRKQIKELLRQTP